MRKIDLFILILGIIGATSWIIISSKDGYKASNATIVARSISINSTIEGRVENTPPAVGTRVSLNQLLVRIHNGRLDRGRLVEFESQALYLKVEIENVVTQTAELQSQLQVFKARTQTYASWFLGDAKLKQVEIGAQLEVANKRRELGNQKVKRAEQLYQKNLSSEANVQLARIEAAIAEKQVKFSKAQFQRSQLMLRTLKQDGVFFENGDTSYWAKMVDTLEIRYFNNVAKLANLEAQLERVKTQADVERQRIDSSFAEEHRAPVSGMVNASFVTKGSRVTSGTSLFQMLDCAQPVIIIPIPDNRISEFSVGLNVTVYPTDTDQALPGKISYVTSGALIGNDTSIQIQQDLILRGNRAIVALDRIENTTKTGLELSESCEAARKAVVVIHTQSTFDTMVSWISSKFPNATSWISSTSALTSETMNGVLSGKG